MRYLTLLLFIFSFSSLNAQDCPPGGLTIDSQEEADAFISDYPNCTRLNGSLSFSRSANVTTGFANIKFINGRLGVQSCAVTGTFAQLDTIMGDIRAYAPDFSGQGNVAATFPKLKYIGGELYVSDGNEHSAHISGSFPALERIEGDISACGNFSSISCNDCVSLNYIGGDIRIRVGGLNSVDTIMGTIDFGSTCSFFGDDYYNLSGYNELKYIGGDLILGGQGECITDFSGFQQLNTINGAFFCYYQFDGSGCANVLDNISGLNQLRHVNGSFALIDMGIENLDFLSNLETVGGNLIVSGNSFDDISGLDHPISVGGTLEITHNRNLSDCAVQAVCDHIDSNDDIEISDNLEDCNSVEEVEDFCNVCVGDLVLTTQEDIDNFAINYPECLVIEGNVTIKGDTPNEINNLDSLSRILSISDTLFIINNHALTNISGLENIDLTELNYVQISGNSMLSTCSIRNICQFIIGEGTASIYDNNENCNSETDILDNCVVCPDAPVYLNSQAEVDEFSSLYLNCTNISYPIEITGDDVNNLNSFIQIEYLEDCLTVEDCPALTNLSGLDNLESAGCLLFEDNGLTDISALSNLTSIQNTFRIWNNSVDLAVLENLQYLGGLSIRGNSMLTDMTLLSSMDSLGNIYLYENDNLVSLDGLQGFTEMGDLTIRDNDALIDMNGLNNIVRANNVRIARNASLVSLEGFNNLTEVSSLAIGYGPYDNPTLQNLSALGNLTTIRGGLVIANTEQLNNLQGLNSLTSIGGGFTIHNNSVLDNLSGLENLLTIGGDFTMGYNFGLTNLEGINNLQTIGGDLKIGYETAGLGGEEAGNGVQDISALSSLTSINGELHIVDNESLTTISNSLENLDHNTITHLVISWNNNLSMCNAQVICGYLNTAGSRSIYYNAYGCRTEAQIETSCQPLPVEMTDPLRVYLKNKTAILQWHTATETNNSGFEIQRSKDGIQWEKIGWQVGQGSTSTPHAYTYTDRNPLSGTSYYRLIQVDFNGDTEYSNMVSLRYVHNGVSVYPNPVKDLLYLDMDSDFVNEITIYNSTGSQVTKIINPDTNIDVSTLPKGIYILKITVDDEDFYEKILVE